DLRQECGRPPSPGVARRVVAPREYRGPFTDHGGLDGVAAHVGEGSCPVTAGPAAISPYMIPGTQPIQHPELAPMSRSVTLDARQRQALLDRSRKDSDPEVRFRAHILLLLADGHTWEAVAALLFCSSRTIDRWVKRFQEEGIEGLAGHKPGRPFRFGLGWAALVIHWVTTKVPRDFGL